MDNVVVRAAPNFAPLYQARVETLADRAYRAVEALFVTGALPPGGLVSEAQIAKLLGFGRTPIREAIKRLESDQLLVPVHRKGIFVREIGIQEYIQLLQAREPIEASLFAMAAVRARASHRGALKACAAKFERSVATQDQKLIIEADYEYKQIAIVATGNPFFEGMLRPIHTLARRFWHMHASYQFTPEAMKEAAGHHLAIIGAVSAAAPSEARRELRLFFRFLHRFAKSVADEPGACAHMP